VVVVSVPGLALASYRTRCCRHPRHRIRQAQSQAQSQAPQPTTTGSKP